MQQDTIKIAFDIAVTSRCTVGFVSRGLQAECTGIRKNDHGGGLHGIYRAEAGGDGGNQHADAALLR
ncbi:hypothetical protein D3C74_493480 [compost metagenome]